MSMSINKHWHVTKNAAAPLLVVISKKSGRTYFKGILKKQSPLSQKDIKKAEKCGHTFLKVILKSGRTYFCVNFKKAADVGFTSLRGHCTKRFCSICGCVD